MWKVCRQQKTEVMPQNVKAIKAILRCEMYLFQSIFQNSEQKYTFKKDQLSFKKKCLLFA